MVCIIAILPGQLRAGKVPTKSKVTRIVEITLRKTAKTKSATIAQAHFSPITVELFVDGISSSDRCNGSGRLTPM